MTEFPHQLGKSFNDKSISSLQRLYESFAMEFVGIPQFMAFAILQNVVYIGLKGAHEKLSFFPKILKFCVFKTDFGGYSLLEWHFWLCGSSIGETWFEWREKLVVTLAENSKPISFIPFPTLTICPESRKLNLTFIDYVLQSGRQDNLSDTE